MVVTTPKTKMITKIKIFLGFQREQDMGNIILTNDLHVPCIVYDYKLQIRHRRKLQ